MKEKERDHRLRLLDRRQLLKVGIAAGAGLLLSDKIDSHRALAQVPSNCPDQPANWILTPFVEPLPRPSKLKPARVDHQAVHYSLSIDQFTHQFHRELPYSPVWGYNKMYPGPTLEAFKNRTVRATFANNLQSYVLCPDLNVHGAFPVPYATIHNHGMLDRQDSDGFPEDRFPPGVSYTYEYPNIQRAAAYWYHDHSLGVTRLAVLSGLAGFYIIRDGCEAELNLPSGEFEVPLLLQDKAFNSDGSIWLAYPWQPEDFGGDFSGGDFAVVNGKVWPFMRVKRGKYRFRMLNGANSRFFNLNLEPPPPAEAFLQIGTDGGLLPHPVDLTAPSATALGGLLLAPAERADVIIDFSVYPAGTEVTVTNNAPAPFPGGGETTLDKIMQFKVMDVEGWPYPIPRKLCSLPVSKPAVRTRYMTLVDYGSPSPGYPPPPDTYPYPTLLLNNKRWMEPPTETPKAGSTEIWNLINLAPDTHPIHLHQTQFRILDRQDFDLEQYLAQYGVDGPLEQPDIPFTGPPVPPYAHENGLKDTVRSNPGQVTRIEVPFGPFTGRFVWHCHMLGHEDNEMMRPLFIV